MSQQDNHPNENLEWRFYGRRAGRKLNRFRQQVMDEVYPKFQISNDLLHSDQSLTIDNLFEEKGEKTILEIGFGNGERLAEMMRRHPNYNYIGAEAFINGVSSFLTEDGVCNSKNLRLLADDALPLVKSLEENAVDEIYILNPDPWHKMRHFKRRIINKENLEAFIRILKPTRAINSFY